MALISTNDPYVHSNIYNFQRQIKGSILDEQSAEGKERIEKQIKEIEKLRNQLKDKALTFLNGKTPEQVSKEILNPQAIYSRIGLEILRTNGMRNSLIANEAYNAESLKNFFTDDTLKGRISEIIKQNSINNEFITFSMDAIVDEVIKTLNNEKIFLNLTGGEQKAALKKIFNGKAAQKRIDNKLKGTLRSEKGKIRNIITELIKESRLRPIKTTSKNSSFDYFKQQFLKKIKDEKITTRNDQSPQEYLATLYSNLQLDDIKDTSNAAGILGEEWLKAVTISDNEFGYDIEVTGKDSEDELAKKYKDWQKMITHHKTDKMAQTDLLITNANGIRVRVQSKNYMEIMQKMIDINNNIPVLAKIQEENSYLELMNALANVPNSNLTQDDIANVSYLLANELWFNTVGSYGDNRRKVTDEKGGLTYVVSQINKYMTKAVTNFLGITLDDAITVNSDASNIFFLINNSVLVPTYEILNGVINQLNNAKEQIFRIQMTLNKTGIKKVWTNAEDFYKAKKNSVNRLDPSKNYSDSSLLGIGKAQGEAIVGSLMVHRVNLNIDLKTLLQSSYGF